MSGDVSLQDEPVIFYSEEMTMAKMVVLKQKGIKLKLYTKVIKKIDKLKGGTNKKPIKTWSRNSTIIPDFVGHSFMIHNGKTFIPITISEEMVGHKLGEFAPTRTFKGHTPADKKAAATEKPAVGDKK